MRWWMTRRVERQATRMHEVMERLDVDAAALARVRQGQDYANARALCLTCGTSDRCLRWLDSKPASSESPAFCPSLRLFEKYRRV
jgi:fructoselysine-6-P-deglycase FrlB-like protein